MKVQTSDVAAYIRSSRLVDYGRASGDGSGSMRSEGVWERHLRVQGWDLMSLVAQVITTAVVKVEDRHSIFVLCPFIPTALLRARSNLLALEALAQTKDEILEAFDASLSSTAPNTSDTPNTTASGPTISQSSFLSSPLHSSPLALALKHHLPAWIAFVF
jgi:hypothetical protein